MKKKLSLLLVLMMLCSLTLSFSAALAEETADDVMAIQEVAFDKENPNYAEVFHAELHNYKVIRSLAPAYEKNSWEAYYAEGVYLSNLNADIIDEDTYPIVEKVIAARKALKQVKKFEECIWYIWGEDMASAEEVSSLVYTDKSWDFEGYKPFLVPYLLKDQSKVKGIMIAVAGGGYKERYNTLQGYPIAEAFNALGYNCFVLQRRVEPFAPEDAWMDLQRSIRYIRYYADEKKIAGTDCIAVSGYSGGGYTIGGAVCNLYGDVQPTIYDADYKADEIDAMNADMDVAVLMYGPGGSLDSSTVNKGWETENPALPYVFIAAGYIDKQVPPNDNIIVAQSIADKTVVDLHMFAKANHGFSVEGTPGTTSELWVPLVDQFIDLFIADQAAAAEKAEEPAK